LTAHHDHDGYLSKLSGQSEGEAPVREYQKMFFTPLLPGTFRWQCWVSAQSILQPLLHSPVPSNWHPTRRRIPGRHEHAGSYATRGQQLVHRQ
jgi:hypothetical protein